MLAGVTRLYSQYQLSREFGRSYRIVVVSRLTFRVTGRLVQVYSLLCVKRDPVKAHRRDQTRRVGQTWLKVVFFGVKWIQIVSIYTLKCSKRCILNFLSVANVWLWILVYLRWWHLEISLFVLIQCGAIENHIPSKQTNKREILYSLND